MAAHALLKDEFTEDEKYHYLMTWLIYQFHAEPSGFAAKNWHLALSIYIVLNDIKTDVELSNNLKTDAKSSARVVSHPLVKDDFYLHQPVSWRYLLDMQETCFPDMYSL